MSLGHNGVHSVGLAERLENELTPPRVPYEARP
jgi:hypothetical protein